jgi:hypothetical protein
VQINFSVWERSWRNARRAARRRRAALRPGRQAKTKDGVGLTQVMARNWLSDFNPSVDRFTGYLNDPYKFRSIINAAGGTVGYLYENRPDQRTRTSAYWENRVAWNSRLSSTHVPALHER